MALTPARPDYHDTIPAKSEIVPSGHHSPLVGHFTLSQVYSSFTAAGGRRRRRRRSQPKQQQASDRKRRKRSQVKAGRECRRRFAKQAIATSDVASGRKRRKRSQAVASDPSDLGPSQACVPSDLLTSFSLFAQILTGGYESGSSPFNLAFSCWPSLQFGRMRRMHHDATLPQHLAH